MDQQDIDKYLPGFIGSLGAMLWIKTSWPRKVAMVAFGSATTYYCAPFLVTTFTMDDSLAGFLVGLFGMSVVDWIFRTYDDGIVNEWLRMKLGLPQKGSDKK